MALTPVSVGNRPQVWSDQKVYLEYMRENQYAQYLGNNENSPIQVIDELTKLPGDAISVPLVSRIPKGGNVGTGILEGNETIIGDFDHKITVKVIRKAFAINDFNDKASSFDIKMAGKTQLKNWAMDFFRDEINEALHSRNKIKYGDATAANHNTWQVDNNDRVMYVGTANSGTHATDLATLTAGVDTISANSLTLAKRKMKTANPKIKPTRVDGSKEMFIFFCDSYMMRDLENDPDIKTAQIDADKRGMDNKIFTGGDIIYRGIVIHEVPELSELIDDPAGEWGSGAASSGLNNAGAAGARVGVGFMLGAQAVGVAYGKRMKTTTDTRDYGFIKGFGVEEFRETEKLLFQTNGTNKVDHGVLTIYAAAALDV